MRKSRFLLLLALLPILLTCRMESLFVGPSSTAQGQLPADTIQDVSRSLSGPFQYETLLPVELSLTVALYRQSQASTGLEPVPAAGELVLVTLENSKGQRLYTGRIPAEGTLNTVFSLPAAPEDVMLTLEAPGFETRRVTIANLVLSSRVSRVMGLLAKDIAAKEVLPDADGDGVPDVYDADPLDPLVTFVNTVPADGFLTVAFEDLYLVANAGDADYNDFVAKYRVSEYSAANGTLSGMTIEAVAKAKLAGYNHDFGMVIDYAGTADIRIEYFNGGSSPYKTTTQSGVQNKAVLLLFESTKDSLNRTSVAHLTFTPPVERSSVSLPPYDPYLYVRNTRYDIHLIGRESLPPGTYPIQNNPPGATFQDSKGFPWALLVPVEWQHPAETQYIGKAYPLFDRWRQSFGQEVPSWYLFRADVPTDPANRAPYPVTSDAGAEPTFNGGQSGQYQLKIASPASLPDPDGDQVIYRSSLLPSFLSLEAATGLVTIAGKAPLGDYVVYFWSEDEHGTSTIDKPYRVVFHLLPISINHPPVASFANYDFEVRGAGNTAVNGGYTLSGTFTSAPYYTHVAGTYLLFRFRAGDGSLYWAIDDRLPANTAPFDPLGNMIYYAGSATVPPVTGWSATSGGDTPPTAVAGIPLSGNTAVFGTTLAAEYIFTDPDKDLEGASQYKWFRFSNSTDTTGGIPIVNNSRTYSTVSADNGKWLRVEVTPVDEHGLTGNPVLSKAVRVGSS